MKKRFFTGLILLVTTGNQAVIAQSATEIIDSHIAAIGGREKIDAVKTMYMEGEVVAPSNSLAGTAVAKIYLLNGKGLLDEVKFTSLSNIEGFSEKGAWRIQMTPKPKALGAAMTAGGQARMTFGGPLTEYKTNGSRVKLVGREDMNGVNAWHIRMITKDTVEFNYWIDPSTWYILKRVINANTGEHLRTDIYSDYRKTEEGIVFPYAAEFKLEISSEFYLVVNKLQFNKEIDPSIFEMPEK